MNNITKTNLKDLFKGNFDRTKSYVDSKFSDDVPKPAGIATPGISETLSRSDHVHPLQTTITGNAGTATKLKNDLVVKLNGGTTEGTNMFTFNGSSAKSMNITPNSIGAAASSHGTHVTYSTTAPKANGAATAGTANNVSRGDHVHPLQTTVSGNAGSANKVNNNLTIKLNSGSSEGTNLFTFNGSAAKNINITPDNIGAATSEHTHSYAGSSTAGGAATEAAKLSHPLLIVCGAMQGSNRYFFDGSSNQSVIINPASIGAAYDNHTHKYAGSSTAGGAATEAAKTTGTLTIQTNGTSAGTFNGSVDKSVNITAANIGAATSNHNHGLLNSTLCKELGNVTTGGWNLLSEDYEGFLLMSLRTNANAPNWLVGNYASGIAFGGSDTKGVISVAYQSPLIKFAGGNGTEPKWNLGITGSNGGYYNMDNFASKNDLNGYATKNSLNNYALTSHTHNYAGSSTAGGVANQAAKTTGSLTIQINGSDEFTFNGSANKTFNITPYGIGASDLFHTHKYAGSSTAGGVATEAAKTTGTLTIQSNGSDILTFNGNANKTLNITPNSIGASSVYHKHSEYATKDDLGNINAILDSINGESL